jgi:predicted kinase
MREPFAEYIKNKLPDGFLLIACGLPGTGKTYTSAKVQETSGGVLLRSDTIRRELFQNEDIFNSKIAADAGKRAQVYDVMFARADEALKTSENVILDATFVAQSLRQRAAAIANKHKKTFIILQTDCPQEVSLRRILARDKENYVSNAITEEAYLDNKKKFEAVDLVGLKRRNPGLKIIHLIVDTAKDPPEEWFVIEEKSA